MYNQYYHNQTLFVPMSCAWYLRISESIFWMLLLSYTIAGNTDGNHNCKHMSKCLVLCWFEIVCCGNYGSVCNLTFSI